MAGNRKAFDKSLNKAAEYAWNRAWSQAIKEYRRALTEFPNDAIAMVGLGIAYASSGQLEPARELFQKLNSATPDDPVVLSHLSDIEERLGHTDQAVSLLKDLAATYEKQGSLDQALVAWKRAASLAPSEEDLHRKLVRGYTELGQLEEAAASAVVLAQVLQTKNRIGEMVKVLRSALMLDPRNQNVRRLLDSIQMLPGAAETQDGAPGGPIDAARRTAWAELAQIVFEDLSVEGMSDTDIVPPEQRYPHPEGAGSRLDRGQVIALVGRAVDLDSKDHADVAIQTYQQVLRAGLDRIAIHYNLGILYKSKGQLEEACRHLMITTFHPTYALAAYLALGDCYQLNERPDLAEQHLIQALKVADLRTIDESRVPDILTLYKSLIESNKERMRSREQSEGAFFKSVGDLFRDENWLARAIHLRKHLDALSIQGVTISLAEGLGTPGFDGMIESLDQIQSLVDRAMLLTAREECYRVIERFPSYLPLHLWLADIFVRQGMVEDAVSKYMVVAEVHEVRGEYAQASSVYRLVLSLTPLDVKARSKLIDLLIERKEFDQALEQYLALADAFYQLARVDKALEKFNEALRLTSRSQSEKAWRLKIMSFIADLYIQRVEWNKAVEIYKQIQAIAPEDYQSGLNLMDLYFKQGKPEQALTEIQTLVQRYEQDKQPQEVIKVLREAVKLRPNEMALRARLSRAYIELGMKQEAIGELDALGELQLEAEMRDQAIQTIRLIISLEPANVRAYKQLLYHLLG